MKKNRNRPGYKKTKTGWIPEDWPCFRLKEAVLQHNAGVYKKQEVYGSGHPIVGVSDLYGIDKIDGQDFRSVPLREEEQRTYGLNEDDLLYGESSLVRSGIARTVYVTRVGAGTAFAWHTRRYSVKRDMLNSAFLYYYLQARPARKFMMSVSTQTALTGITTTDYFQCPIPSPSLPEQEAIAEVLKCWDKAIWGYERKIEKKRNIKKGLMQRLLSGKQRLPGFVTTENTEGHGKEKDGIPVGWKEVRLGDILDAMRNGCVYDPVETDGLPVTRIETISDGVIDYAKTGRAKDSPEIAGYRLQSGDILYSHINSVSHIGKVALFDTDRALYHGMNLLLLRADNATDSRFLFYSLTAPESRKQAQRLAKKAVSQASINTSELKKMRLVIPANSEQRAITAVLSSADAEIAALDRKLAVLREQKRFLLNNMVTGTIRLPQFVSTDAADVTTGDSV